MDTLETTEEQALLIRRLIRREMSRLRDMADSRSSTNELEIKRFCSQVTELEALAAKLE